MRICRSLDAFVIGRDWSDEFSRKFSLGLKFSLQFSVATNAAAPRDDEGGR